MSKVEKYSKEFKLDALNLLQEGKRMSRKLFVLSF